MDRYFYHDNKEKVEVVDHNELIAKLVMHNPYYITQTIKPLIGPDLLRLVNEGRITEHGLVPFKLNTSQPDWAYTFKAELNLLPRHYPKMFPDFHLNVNNRLYNNTPAEYQQHHACTALVHYNPRLDGGNFVVPEDVVFETLRVENVPIAQFMPILLQHPYLDLHETKTLFQMLDIYNRQWDAVNERVGENPLMPKVQEVVSQADVEADSDESWRSSIRLKYAAENWLAKNGYVMTRPQCFVCGFNAGDPDVKDKMLDKVQRFNKRFYHPDRKDFAYAATDLKQDIHIMVYSNNPTLLNNAHMHCLGFKDMLVVEEQPFRDIRLAGCQQATLQSGDKQVDCRVYKNPLFDNHMAEELCRYRTDGQYLYPWHNDVPDTEVIFIDQLLNVYKDEKIKILSTRPVDRHLEERFWQKEVGRPLMYRPTERGAWFYQNGGQWCVWLDKNRQQHNMGQVPGMAALKRINEIATSQNIVLCGKLVLRPLDDLGTRTYMKPSSGNVIDVSLTLCADGKVHTSLGDRLTNMDGWYDVTGRVTEAVVHELNANRMTVQCKIDGEVQMPKEVNLFYRKLYQGAVAAGTTDQFVRQLAHNSFKDELMQEQTQQQSRGFRR